MPTFANLPAADVQVKFPDGTVINVNMIRLLAHTINAEWKARTGEYYPPVAKLRPTVKSMRAEYSLPAWVNTWDLLAQALRSLHTQLKEQGA